MKFWECVIALLFCNATGIDLYKPLVIGKAVKPRCFKNINTNQLSMKWAFSQKASMNHQLFIEWISEFDRAMGWQKWFTLKNMTLKFFTANTTSHLQPIKTLYRKRLL